MIWNYVALVNLVEEGLQIPFSQLINKQIINYNKLIIIDLITLTSLIINKLIQSLIKQKISKNDLAPATSINNKAH